MACNADQFPLPLWLKRFSVLIYPGIQTTSLIKCSIILSNCTVIVHSNCVRRSLYLKQGSEAFVEVVKDLSKDGHKFKATEASNIADFELDPAAKASAQLTAQNKPRS